MIIITYFSQLIQLFNFYNLLLGLVLNMSENVCDSTTLEGKTIYIVATENYEMVKLYPCCLCDYKTIAKVVIFNTKEDAEKYVNSMKTDAHGIDNIVLERMLHEKVINCLDTF